MKQSSMDCIDMPVFQISVQKVALFVSMLACSLYIPEFHMKSLTEQRGECFPFVIKQILQYNMFMFGISNVGCIQCPYLLEYSRSPLMIAFQHETR